MQGPKAGDILAHLVLVQDKGSLARIEVTTDTLKMVLVLATGLVPASTL